MTGANSSGAQRDVSRPVPSWNDALLTFIKWCQGRVDLTVNLSTIAAHFGADFAGLSRWDEEGARLRTAGFVPVNRTKRTAVAEQGFADTVCGAWTGHLKAGAALLHSEIKDELQLDDARLAQWMHQNNICDIGIICVAVDGRKRDLIELHFSAPPKRNWATVSALQAPCLADVYAGRSRGLIVETIFQNGRSSARSKPAGETLPILSSTNPMGLTRCEWSICVLIANGLSRDGIANELCVKPSTVQTHLRNIYAKTGYPRFHALALQLVSPEERAHLALVQGGMAA